MARQLPEGDAYRAYALAGAQAELEKLAQKTDEIYTLFPELRPAAGIGPKRDIFAEPDAVRERKPTPAPTPPLRSKVRPKPDDDELLSAPEAAAVANVTAASIYRWRQVGYLQSRETPEGARFTRKDVLAAAVRADEIRRAKASRGGDRSSAGAAKREPRTAPEEPAAAAPAGNLKTCERCGKEFEPAVGVSGRFCNRDCYEGKNAGDEPATAAEPIEEEPEPLSLHEAAAYAKVPYTTIYSWQRRGLLASLGSNGHGALYDPRAVDLAKTRAAASPARMNNVFVSSAV